MPLIEGGGGGKSGGGHTPVEAPDSLRSLQTAQSVDLLCEGEIEGLVNGLKSVYLDGVPLQNADGSMNFENVQFAYTTGTQNQAALPGFDSVQNEVAVGVLVLHATALVRTITDADVDTVRVTIAVPNLSKQSITTGDLSGSQFSWAIDIQSNGGGFVQVYVNTVTGKTTSTYAKSVKLKLTGPAPWDVRLRRVSADSTTTTEQNAFSWASYTEIKSLRLRYPNSAVAALQVSAKQFARIPVRAYDIMGQLVEVPVNYDPLTRAYTGTWNGTFKTAWTDNPAWIFREVAVHPRWGCGKFIKPEQVNKWALYRIAQYCDGLVPDGRGGMEPRFTCNLYLQTQEQARKVLQDLAAVFRGMSFWAGSELHAVQDAPADPQVLYTPGNVVDGNFDYQSSSELTRHSVFICSYNSLSQLGKRVPEVYAPRDLVARYGIRDYTLSPIGVWSRGQAARLCRWAAYSESMEGEIESHRVGADGALVMPGAIYQVADPNEAGERLGGRVSAATTGTVTLDGLVELRAGESYMLACQFPNPAPSDATPDAYLTVARPVTTAPGVTNVLTVFPLFDVAPAAQDTWLLQSDQVVATSWRCIAVVEVPGKDQYEITGVAHQPQKFDLIELGIDFDPRPISRLTLVPPAVASLAFTETVYTVSTVYRSRVTVSWPAPAPGLDYAVSWRLEAGPWNDLPLTSANSIDLDSLTVGALDIQIKTVNALGNYSALKTGSFAVAGNVTRPSDVAGFTATIVQGGVKFAWTKPDFPTYLDTHLEIGGSVLHEGGGVEWTWAWPPLGTYTVTAVHIDTSLKRSADPASVTFTIDSNIQAHWEDLADIPYGDILNNDDSVALGFSLEKWPAGQAYPTGWGQWDSPTPPTRETTLVRIGAESLRWAANRGNVGMFRGFNFPSTPLPAGTFLAGSIDIYLVARTSGVPGMLVRLYTNAGLTTYRDTLVVAPSTATGAWQRVPWSARANPNEQIYAVHIYITASWQSTPADFIGQVLYDNLLFALYDASTDNKQITIAADGTLNNGGGGQVTINGLGYSGALDATRNKVWLQIADPALTEGAVADGDTWHQQNSSGVVIATWVRIGGVWVSGPPSAGLFTLITRGQCVGNGGTITKVGGANLWDSDAYSLEAYANGAYVSFQGGQTSLYVALGLNTDPGSSAHFDSIDFAWVLSPDGLAAVYQNGTGIIGSLPYTTASVFSITYDGSRVQYLIDGVVKATTSGVAANLKLFLDSSFAGPGAILNNIRFGPSGAKGTDGANAKLLVLTATSQVFQVPKSGSASPASITFKAYGQNLTSTPGFALTAGSASFSFSDAYTAVLTYANMASDLVTLTVNGDGLSDSITVVKVREGSDALSPFLTNQSVTVAADKDGNVASYAGADGEFKLYLAATELTSGVTYSVFSESNVHVVINASTGIYYVTTMAADVGSAVLRAVYGGTTLNLPFNISKSRAGATGAQGAPAAVFSLTPPSLALPADVNGVVSSYSGATSTCKVVLGGTTDDTANWTFSKTASSSGVTASVSGTTLTISGLADSVDTGTVTVSAARSGYLTQTAVFTLSKAKSATASSGVVPFLTRTKLSFTTAPTAARAQITFNSNGTISVNGAAAGNWYLPTTGGIGSSYYIEVFLANGDASGTLNQAVSLSTNPTWGFLGPSGAGSSANDGFYNFAIATDSGMTDVVGTGTFKLQAEKDSGA